MSASLFSIRILANGAGSISQWTISRVTGDVPDLQFHLYDFGVNQGLSP
jgi:hypothetical protein